MKEKTAKELLIESERRLSMLMSTLPGMAYRCMDDEEWTMLFVSAGCEALTGFKPEALLNNARISYAGLIHPEDRYGVWIGVNEGIKNKKMFRLSYRIITKGGTEKWVLEQGRGVFREGEEQVIEGFITDITELKTAEKELARSLKEKELLMNEIHHRVKNNMQLIISMLMLQQEKADPELTLFINKTIERINVFIEIHQELYQSDSVSQINIAEHIRDNLTRLCIVGNEYQKNIKLELNIPDPFLNLDIALPVGLIINELLTNSLKHAFRDSSGTITISIIKNPENRIEMMSYTDTGKKIKTDKEGFGTLLITNLAAQMSLSLKADTNSREKFFFSAL